MSKVTNILYNKLEKLKYENRFNNSFLYCDTGAYILFHRVYKRKQEKADNRGCTALLYYRRYTGYYSNHTDDNWFKQRNVDSAWDDWIFFTSGYAD